MTLAGFTWRQTFQLQLVSITGVKHMASGTKVARQRVKSEPLHEFAKCENRNIKINVKIYVNLK